ncbi:serine hydrolase [Limnovirga soli]|uniref:Serine hydrolase n=1 Tax=Limnovirga soli TaxID=2656915 RepID=A0A8J8F9H5_9BACT|nr:serine hydrolase [Limnovirga soli]NNV53985.1 serine hydrolase [Limnovirga soli]
MRKLFALLALAASPLFISAQKNSTVYALDSVLNYLYATHQFNGTVLYAENGKVLYKKAFGIADSRTGQPLQTNSAFNLASDTKQFICMCIMLLKEKGRLSYEDDITKYIPELPYKGISIRHLMTHTSGLPEYDVLFQNTRGPLDTLSNEGMIKMLETLHPPLNVAPGTKWEYSNTGYILLSSLIERIAKMPTAQFINNNIVKPLGLHQTYLYNVYMPSPNNRVFGFEETNGRQQLNDLFYLDGVTGDGNLYSSVEDLYIWEQSLYSEKLVKKATYSDALKPVTLSNGNTYPYGFGWFIGKQNEYYYHTGSWAGFRNIICRDTKNNRTLILLSNNTNSLPRELTKNIFEGIPYTLPALQLITNVTIIDGVNTPARKASVRIKDNMIIAVGNLSPYPGETVIDGGGKILTPGFIDTHSHLDRTIWQKPEGIPAVNQGVTTIVVGQDGESDSLDSIQAWMQKTPVAINLASYTGHTTLRAMVMGDNDLHRISNEKELEAMQLILAGEMKKGSLGLATGLEYEGAHFSSRNEVVELSKTAAQYHGRYISHMRSEDIGLADAIDEVVNIGLAAKIPVQISHFKIALKNDWGTAPAILANLEKMRQNQHVNITADCYPYEYWYSTLRVLFPKTDFTNMESALFAVEQTIDPSGSVVFPFAPNKAYEGKTLSAIAAMRNQSPAQTLIDLIEMVNDFESKNPGIDAEGILGKSMTDEDIIQLLSWANTNICSDGGDGGHPRGYGAFTRVLGYYVRERKIMSLENAIYKMTGLAAEHVGLANRGIIAPGYYADLVLLDPATVKDNATIQNPTALSEGIVQVWVNGKIVYHNKQSTHQYPGTLLKRALE